VFGSGRADGAVVPDLNDKKGHNHETYDNRISKCFCPLEHGRHGASHDRRVIRCDPGTSWDCRIWISRGSVSGVVRVAVGRLDECRPHLEQHRPRSASAQCACTSVTPPGTPLPRSACHGADNMAPGPERPDAAKDARLFQRAGPIRLFLACEDTARPSAQSRFKSRVPCRGMVRGAELRLVRPNRAAA
jgi:hypothetical protein